MKETQYIIVKAHSASALTDAVNKYLKSGFTCVGGVSFNITAYSRFSHGETVGTDFDETWAQAMFKAGNAN